MSMILVAVELEFGKGSPCRVSPSSQEALSQAIRLARAGGHGLRLAHVCGRDSGDEEGREMPLRHMILDQWVQAIRASGLSAEWLYLYGDPAAELLSLSHEFPPPMLVVGTRQRSDGSGILAGSVAARVLAEARVPVCVARHQASAVRRLLIATDLREDDPVLRAGLRLAGCLDLVPRVLHVLRPTESPTALRRQLAELIETADARGGEARLRLQDCQLVEGSFASSLAEQLRAQRPEFLVLGRSGTRGLTAMLAEDSADLVWREVPCSVFAVPVTADCSAVDGGRRD